MRIAGTIATVVFITLFASAVVYLVFIYEYDDFDYYKTDIDIVVNEDGSLNVTETYHFRWSDIETGEVYITFPDEKVNSVDRYSIKCFIDGKEATRVSYEVGHQATFSGADDMALYSYGLNSFYDDYIQWEINAFFKRSMSGGHTVSFQYKLNDVVTRYTDCVELYYKVFDSFSDDLKDLTVTVTMPAGSQQDKTYIFGHGDPNGYCEFPGTGADAVFRSSSLSAYTMYEIRVVNEQVDLYPLLTEKTDKTLASILAEEKAFQDETAFRIFLKNIFFWLIAAMMLSGILIAILRFKLVKRNKPTFNQIYNRDLPSLKPNIAASLADHYKLKKGNIGNKITATILSLAVEKVISIEKSGGDDIIFTPLNPNAQLTSFERSVYRLLFSKVSENAGVTLSQLKKDVGKNSTDTFNLFENDRSNYAACGYEDNIIKQRRRLWKYVSLIPFVLALASIAILIKIEFYDYIPLIAFPGFVILVMLAVSYEKTPTPLTVNGEDERAKILALKKFYTDMTLMKERRMMELSLWEKHLVYATALGVADKVMKELDVRLAEMRMPSSGTAPFFFIYTLHSVGGLSKSISSINNASYAAFIRSSGVSGSGGGYSSGGGGGFSGGGGGGFGGGGGGHR